MIELKKEDIDFNNVGTSTFGGEGVRLAIASNPC